eukprot:scaffold6934_cov66-Phaeocystis_antarctica.AAC.1
MHMCMYVHAPPLQGGRRAGGVASRRGAPNPDPNPNPNPDPNPNPNPNPIPNPILKQEQQLQLSTILPSFIVGPPRTPRTDGESLRNMRQACTAPYPFPIPYPSPYPFPRPYPSVWALYDQLVVV